MLTSTDSNATDGLLLEVVVAVEPDQQGGPTHCHRQDDKDAQPHDGDVHEAVVAVVPAETLHVLGCNTRQLNTVLMQYDMFGLTKQWSNM